MSRAEDVVKSGGKLLAHFQSVNAHPYLYATHYKRATFPLLDFIRFLLYIAMYIFFIHIFPMSIHYMLLYDTV